MTFPVSVTVIGIPSCQVLGHHQDKYQITGAHAPGKIHLWCLNCQYSAKGCKLYWGGVIGPLLVVTKIVVCFRHLYVPSVRSTALTSKVYSCIRRKALVGKGACTLLRIAKIVAVPVNHMQNTHVPVAPLGSGRPVVSVLPVDKVLGLLVGYPIPLMGVMTVSHMYCIAQYGAVVPGYDQDSDAVGPRLR